MKIHELHPPEGAKKRRKIVGRGDSSGHGNYSGRGMKGQKARSGGKVPPYFEGGQLPLIRRLPHKKGFTSIFKVKYQIVNLKDLAKLNSEVITPQILYQEGLIDDLRKPVKILAEGELKGPLTIKAHKFSQQAKEKIVAAGGQVEEINWEG